MDQNAFYKKTLSKTTYKMLYAISKLIKEKQKGGGRND